MVTKKLYFMDRMIDFGMTKFFQLAEYVCSKCSLDKSEPVAPQSQAHRSPCVGEKREKD